MPILNEVESRSLPGRLFLLVVYVLVILGGLSMVYPFAIMLVGSITSGVDTKEYRLIPSYFHDDNTRFFKYAEYKYTYKQNFNRMEQLNRNWGTDFSSIENMKEEAKNKHVMRRLEIPKDKRSARCSDWKEFSAALPLDKKIRCFDFRMLHDFKLYILKKYPDMNEIKTKLEVDPKNLVLPFEDPYKRNWKKPSSEYYSEYLDFLKTLDKSEMTIPIVFDNEFVRSLRIRYPSEKELNAALGTDYKSFADIPLGRSTPENGLSKEWLRYVSKNLPLQYLGLSLNAEKYRSYVKERFSNIKNYNSRAHANYSDFSQIPVPDTAMLENIADRNLLLEYLLHSADASELKANTQDNDFRDMMAKKYGGKIEQLNSAWGTDFKDFREVKAPVMEYDFHEFSSRKLYWLNYYLFNNYVVVWRYIALQGRALWNTLILCVATVVCTLTVNPMCAYALSRYNIKNKYAILMFFIATMAFPGMVLMIPNFILLKELNLLNTYWALILPGMASGYYIFMMKGFFDSLPRELYEAAAIDGANEFQIFTQITLPLIKPIMAVKGLAAFTAAYSGFMWAFIICQDPKMWTISVYLYQFQLDSPQHLVMASLVLASLPLLLTFIFCQKLILRGIIIPVMK